MIFKKKTKWPGPKWKDCKKHHPKSGMTVLLLGKGGDIVVMKEGETLDMALIRNIKETELKPYWKEVGYYSKEEKCYISLDGCGFPMNPQPRLWKEIDWS